MFHIHKETESSRRIMELAELNRPNSDSVEGREISFQGVFVKLRAN